MSLPPTVAWQSGRSADYKKCDQIFSRWNLDPKFRILDSLFSISSLISALAMSGENLVLLLFCLSPAAFAAAMMALARSNWWRARAAAWMRVALFNFLVLVFLLTLLLAIGEIYYRFVYDESDPVNYTKVSRRWFERYYRE